MNSNERILKNNSYYDRFITEVKTRSETRDISKALELFLSHMDSNKTIVDIGCGTGNHLEEFKKRGFIALGIEPSKKMREVVEARGLQVIDGTFENIKSLGLTHVGGIWCAASFLHVPQEEFHQTLKNLNDLLEVNDPFYFTVRLGEGAKWDSYDDANGDETRFIQLFSEEYLLTEMSALPFKNIQHWTEDSTWGRHTKWISIFACKA